MKIFISYSKDDKRIAGELKKYFEHYENIECFIAHDDIKPGTKWEEDILSNLSDADYFLPLQTVNLIKSYWCQQEAGIAFNREIKIIPLIPDVDGIDPVGFYAKYQGFKIKVSDLSSSVKKFLIKENVIVDEDFEENGKSKQKSDIWQKIGRFKLLIGIIVAFLAILTYFGIRPKMGPPLSNINDPDKQIARIHFEQSHPFVIREVLGNDITQQYWSAYFFRIQVFNKSYDSNIRIKHLKLTDLRKLDGDVFKPWENAVPAILEWPVRTNKELSPREDAFVPFARIFPPELQKLEDTLLSGNIEIPQLRFVVANWNRQMTSHVPPGTHRFKLTAFFENAPPTEAEFQLEWSGEHREGLDSMAEDIKIKQIK